MILQPFGPGCEGIAVGISIPMERETFAVAMGRTEVLLGTLLHKWFFDPLASESLLVAALEDGGPPIKIIWLLNEALMLSHVNNWRKAYAIIKERLEALDLLKFAHISYSDSAEGIWRPLWPEGKEAFDPAKMLARWTAKLPPAP